MVLVYSGREVLLCAPMLSTPIQRGEHYSTLFANKLSSLP